MGLTLWTGASLFAFLACAILSPFVLLKGRKGRQTYLFSGLTFLAGTWCLFPFAAGQVPGDFEAIRIARLVYFIALFVPPVFLHLTYAILDLPKTNWDRTLLRCFYVVSVLFVPVLPTDLFIKGVLRHAPFFGMVPGPFYAVYVMFFGVTCAIGFGKLLQGYRHASGFKKNQLRYIFLSWFLAYIAGLLHFMPAYFRVELFPHDFLVIAFVGISSYAIVKYRLMNINIAVTRVGLFLAIYAPLLALPFVVGKFLESWLLGLVGANWWMVPAMFEALFAVGGLMVYRYVQRKAEARLLKEQRHYQTTLLNAAKGMTQIRSLQHLLSLIVHMLTRSMKLTHAGVFMEDGRSGQYVLQASRDRDVLVKGLTLEPDDVLIAWLKKEQAPLVSEEIRQMVNGTVTPENLEATLKRIGASVVVPSFAEDELIGFLVLGDKKTGQMYSQDDLNTLQTLANQAALAIQNAEFYQELQTKTAELIHTARLTSMGKMASGIAHQMRNRFGCLMGEANLAQAMLSQLQAPTATNQKQQEAVELIAAKLASICEEGEKGVQIVKHLLEFSKPAMDRALISLREIVERGIGHVGIKHDLTQLTLYIDVPQDHPYVHVSVSEWQDVFFNLMDNAAYWVQAKAGLVEYGHLKLPESELPFGGKIAITATPSEDHTKFLIRVTDNGLGMKPDDQEKLFLPFFTLKGSSEERTGIGLYFVWEIVRAHGGSIKLGHSAYGKGTTFLIELPIPEQERQWLR